MLKYLDIFTGFVCAFNFPKNKNNVLKEIKGEKEKDKTNKTK